MSQAEHGYDSPVCLVTDSRPLASAVLELMPAVIAELPEPQVAKSCWDNYGEVILCRDRNEMAEVADELSMEHVQVMAGDPEWWLGRLRNYGSLFLGEGSTVSYGDKTSGPNHILPTKRAARYSGGLSVGKFIKTVTYQEVSPRLTAGSARWHRASRAWKGWKATPAPPTSGCGNIFQKRSSTSRSIGPGPDAGPLFTRALNLR